jgi:SAM-dependent methyltransferase
MSARNPIAAAVARALPVGARRWLRAQQIRLRLQWPPRGTVHFGSLRRLRPISRRFGFDRGRPIDRYYIEEFLGGEKHHLRGRVLEVGDDRYMRMFGGDQIARRDVLHVLPDQPGVTIVADLTRADHVPANTFDCIICTQSLQVIYDLRPALCHLHRILKPGGVMLATGNGITKTGRHEGVDPWGQYWHFTTQSFGRLFRESFPSGEVQVSSYGNVLSAIAFLHGLAAEELTVEELSFRDPDYEVLVTARAVKAKTS